MRQYSFNFSISKINKNARAHNRGIDKHIVCTHTHTHNGIAVHVCVCVFNYIKCLLWQENPKNKTKTKASRPASYVIERKVKLSNKIVIKYALKIRATIFVCLTKIIYEF